jgi:hypothetical protein
MGRGTHPLAKALTVRQPALIMNATTISNLFANPRG